MRNTAHHLACLVLVSVATLGRLPAQQPTPGETSGVPLAQLQVAKSDPVAGTMTLTFQSACEATSNNVYFGALDAVSSLAWSGEVCGVGPSGTLKEFDPGTDSYFFVVVGNRESDEGSYGKDRLQGLQSERTAYTGNTCGQMQDLSNPCTPAAQGGVCTSSLDCGSRQRCLSTPAGPPVCSCLQPFTGAFCESCSAGFAGPDCRDCEPGFVSNAIQAANDDDEPPEVVDFELLTCEGDVPGSCAGVSCSGHGMCVVMGHDAACACEEGYAGEDCSDCAPDYQDDGAGGCELGLGCREAKCGGHGDCVATPFGDVTCSCDAGFDGVDCGGPDLAIQIDTERFSLYDGETVVLEPVGGIGPFTWDLVEGPARLIECSGGPLTEGGPPCPANGAQLTIVAPAGGIQEVQLVKISLADGAGNSASDDLAAIPSTFLPFTGEVHSELIPFYQAMLKYMRARGIRGGALAVSKGGKIVGANGYGYRNAGIDADPFVNAGEGPGPLVQPDSPFRLASISKTMTAAAVRDAALDAGVNIGSTSQASRAATWVAESIGFDLVSGAPPFDYNLLAPLTTDSRWANISIRHLLNHHGGFFRDVVPPSTTGQPDWDAKRLPFTEDLDDPNMLQTARYGASSEDLTYATMYIVAALTLAADPRPHVENVIRFAGGTLLNYNPGGSTAAGDNYSNLGYILLGRVLEGLRAETYEPDEPGVPSGWGAYPTLVQDYLCEASGILNGVFPGDAFNPQPLEPYYRDLNFQGVENLAWNMAEGADKIRFNAGIQQWQFCQSGCPNNGAVWNDELNTPAAYGGIWLAERNSAGGMLATAPALLRFARNHRIKVGTPNEVFNGIGSLLPAPGAHGSSSSHSGSISGTSTQLWQMAGNRTNWIPFDTLAWNDDPAGPLDLDGDGDVLIDESLIGFNCNLPSDVVVAALFNQRQDRRAPRSNDSDDSNSSSSTVYRRIIDFLGDAACQVDQGGWPTLGNEGPALAVPCP